MSLAFIQLPLYNQMIWNQMWKYFFFKFLSDSTQSVDSVWPLALDQDLIDTLKVSFPNWFSSSTTAITEGGGKSGLNAATDKNSTISLKTTLDGMEEGNNRFLFIFLS